MIAFVALALLLLSPPDAVVQEHKFLLEGMEMADQDARDRMISAVNNNQNDRIMALMHDCERIDRANTATMKEIVATWGWPRISTYGRRHAHIAWLLVQHADLDRPFQQKCLRLMEPLVAKKEVLGSDYAYLFDRVARGQGRPQRYGTQYIFKDKRLVMQDLRGPEERRQTARFGRARADQGVREGAA